MLTGVPEAVMSFLDSIGVNAQDLASKIMVSIIVFLLALAWNNIFSGIQGIALFLQRKLGRDPYKNIYGHWFYYRKSRRTTVEITLLIKPRWFSKLPAAIFDATNYNGVLGSRGEVTFSDSNMFIHAQGLRSQNFQKYPFLIVLKYPHPTLDITLGTVCGQMVANGKAYSAPVLICRNKLDKGLVDELLEETTIIDDLSVWNAIELIEARNSKRLTLDYPDHLPKPKTTTDDA